jgi:hypothetical protein
LIHVVAYVSVQYDFEDMTQKTFNLFTSWRQQ